MSASRAAAMIAEAATPVQADFPNTFFIFIFITSLLH
jgi:hypothetical protein